MSDEDQASDERIARFLDRIADALERTAKANEETLRLLASAVKHKAVRQPRGR